MKSVARLAQDVALLRALGHCSVSASLEQLPVGSRRWHCSGLRLPLEERDAASGLCGQLEPLDYWTALATLNSVDWWFPRENLLPNILFQNNCPQIELFRVPHYRHVMKLTFPSNSLWTTFIFPCGAKSIQFFQLFIHWNQIDSAFLNFKNCYIFVFSYSPEYWWH